jgi:hypothetical protein
MIIPGFVGYDPTMHAAVVSHQGTNGSEMCVHLCARTHASLTHVGSLPILTDADFILVPPTDDVFPGLNLAAPGLLLHSGFLLQHNACVRAPRQYLDPHLTPRTQDVPECVRGCAVRARHVQHGRACHSRTQPRRVARCARRDGAPAAHQRARERAHLRVRAPAHRQRRVCGLR